MSLASKREFYAKLRERSTSYVKSIADKERNRDVLKHNLNVLIDLCDKRLNPDDRSHNEDNGDRNHNSDSNRVNGNDESDTVERVDGERAQNAPQISVSKFNKTEPTLEESIESAEKWITKMSTDSGRRYKCEFNGCRESEVLLFRKRSQVLAHVWGHTGHKPYKCGESGCDYRARTKSTLWKHRKSHSQSRPDPQLNGSNRGSIAERLDGVHL